MNHKMDKLKPCPFCGWGTIVDGGFLNHKCTCNACGASTKGYPTWELAIEAWNRRDGEHMNDDLISRVAVMQSLTREYNRRRTGDGLKLAWIEKAVNDVPSEPLTINGVTLYMCDPKKNTPCSKTNCFMNGGECMRTTYKEYREEQHGSD